MSTVINDIPAVQASTPASTPPYLRPIKANLVIERVSILHRTALAIVEREIRHLAETATVAKLSNTDARDLREYTTLLSSMKKAHNEATRERTERYRARLAKKAEKVSMAELEATANGIK